MRKLSQWWPVIVGAFVLCSLLMSASTAAADEPTAEERERAAAHFEDGAEYFFEERYGRALVEFRRAFRLNPHPMIAYNKALANLRLGNIGEAYRRAVEASEMGGLPPDEELRNNARIRALGVVLTAEQVADDVESAIVDGAQREEIERAQREETAGQAEELAQLVGQKSGDLLAEITGEAPREPLVPVRPTDDDSGGLGPVGITGVVMTSVGAGLLGVAGVTNHRLGDKIATYESASDQGDTDEFFRLREDIESSQRNGQIALYAGAGAAAVGVVLVLVDGLSGSSSERSGLSLTPSTTPGGSPGGLIQLHGKF